MIFKKLNIKKNYKMYIMLFWIIDMKFCNILDFSV